MSLAKQQMEEPFSVQGRLLRWNEGSGKWDPHPFLANPPGVKLHHVEVSPSPDGVVNQVNIVKSSSIQSKGS